MKKIFNKIKNNIFLTDLIFIIFNILLNILFYIFNIRFRLWFIIFIIIISILGFIIGIIQLLYKSSENKKTIIIFSLLYVVCMIIFIIIVMPFVSFVSFFCYRPEHTVILDGKKYVAVVNSFLHVDVDYYDYYGPLLMGTKVRVHGYFGEGGFNPFVNFNNVSNVEYTYYDSNEKIISKKEERFIRDDEGNIIDRDIYEKDINNENKYNENDNYILPEQEEVLYEKKFNETILRFGKVDSGLGQNILVHVLRSKDNGKNFYVISDDLIKVSNEAKFVFLNENLGFVISTGKIFLKQNVNSMYVTNDSGKTFQSSNFKYENDNVTYLDVVDLPYFENDTLKIKCSAYQFNSDIGKYEDKELIFISNDNGLNWELDK